MDINIRHWGDLVKSGLYVIYSPESMEAYIGHSTNFMIALERNITQINKKISPITELNSITGAIYFQVLEIEEDYYKKLLRHNHYCNEYTDKGYTLLNKREAIDLAPRAIVEEGKVVVKLVNRTQRIPVGVFEKMDEAKEFIKYYYPENKVINIIYASNSLTRELISHIE